MRNRIGIILMGIAVLHEAVGIFFYRDALLDIVSAGFFNTINPPYWERDAAFWFSMFGVTLFLMGWIAQWMLEKYRHNSKILWLGITRFMRRWGHDDAASGFWLAIPVAIVMLRLPETQTKNFVLSS